MHSNDEIDVDDIVEISEFIERLRGSHNPLLLRRGNEVIAQIIPMSADKRRPVKARTPEGHQAFIRSAGSWADIDVERFLDDVYESRDLPSRQQVEY